MSGPSNQGGGVDVDKDYNPAALPTICLIAPDKEVVEKDIWPASEILPTLAKYDFNPTPIDNDFQGHISYTGNLPEMSINNAGSQKITFFTSVDGNYKLLVYSADGKVVIQIADRFFTKGINDISWNSNGLSKGLFFVELRSEKQKVTKKILLY